MSIVARSVFGYLSIVWVLVEVFLRKRGCFCKIKICQHLNRNVDTFDPRMEALF